MLLLLLLGLEAGLCGRGLLPIISLLPLFVVKFLFTQKKSAMKTEQRPLLEELNDSVAGFAGLLNTGISLCDFNGNEMLQSRASDRWLGSS